MTSEMKIVLKSYKKVYDFHTLLVMLHWEELKCLVKVILFFIEDFAN